MTRARCRYLLHLGEFQLSAGCGRVHVQGSEWTDADAVQIQDVDTVIDGICKACGQEMLRMQAFFRAATEDQHAWQMSLPIEQRRPRFRKVETDPFRGFRPGE